MATMVWAVQDALLGALTGPAEDAGARVFDGQRKSGDTPKLFLVVGSDSDDPFTDPDDVVDALASTAQQSSSTLGAGDWRDERGGVLCSIVAWSGAADFSPLRTMAAAVLSASEAAVAADRSLGGLLVGPGAELGEIRVWERRTKQGTAVGVVFTVTYQATITT